MSTEMFIIYIGNSKINVQRVTRVIPNKADAQGRPVSFTLVKDSPQDDTVEGEKLGNNPGVGQHAKAETPGANAPGSWGNREDYTLSQLQSSGFISVWQQLHPEDETFGKAAKE